MSNSGEYWEERFRQLEAAQHDTSVQKMYEIEQQFRRSQSVLEGQINAWYQRFADNNGISMTEARRLLNGNELEELRWSVQEYIEKGRTLNYTDEWAKALENASARAHINRLEAIKLQTQMEMEKLFGNCSDVIDGHIKDIYVSGYYHTAYEIQKRMGVGWSMSRLNEEKLSAIIHQPWAADGRNFSDRIWTSKTQLINQLHDSLTRMCITGEAPDRAITELAKKMGVSKSQAGNIIMTESAAFSAKAQEKCYADLGIKEFQVVETLDSVTCDICAEMDGQHFPMSDYKIGVTVPPFHPRCRGCTCPYFDDDFTVGERIARGADGKQYEVPENMTYKGWKKAFVDDDKSFVLRGMAANATMDILKMKEDTQVHFVGKINSDYYKCIMDDIVTEDVIITDERIAHIKERHPNDYERYYGYLKEIVAHPQYIVETNKPYTALILKEFAEGDEQFKTVLRLKTSNDNPDFKNSIITFMKINDKEWKRLLKNKRILYKAE